MPDVKAAPQAEGYEVIFAAKWVDTTRHGYNPEADGADDAGDAAE